MMPRFAGASTPYGWAVSAVSVCSQATRFTRSSAAIRSAAPAARAEGDKTSLRRADRPAPPDDLPARPSWRLYAAAARADSGCAAVWAADPGQPPKGERGPGAGSQQVFETLKVARHIAVDERDPDTRIDGKPAVLPAHLSIAALDVSIDSGASTDWGKLCYPPTQ